MAEEGQEQQTIAGYKVHPVAALFPMLGEDQLTALAEDIKKHGQIYPIVLDAEGQVLDGRNRLKACERAGVTPETKTYTGDDPEGYALAVNGQRRDLTRGQRAQVAARAKLLPGNNHLTQQMVSDRVGVPQSEVSKALLIEEETPDIGDQVVQGASFKDAYSIARQHRDTKLAREKRLEAIKPEQPSLYERTKIDPADPEYLTPQAALEAAATIRREEERDRREQAALAATQLAREQIEAPIEIPKELAIEKPPAKGKGKDTEKEDEQGETTTPTEVALGIVKRLIEARDILKGIEEQGAFLDGKDPWGQLNAVQSALHNIKAYTVRINNQYATESKKLKRNLRAV